MGGNAIKDLAKSFNSYVRPISASELSSIFPINSTPLKLILDVLIKQKLISSRYSPRYILGSTRLAARMIYGERIKRHPLETNEIIKKANKKKQVFGDLDIDLIFTSEKQKIASTINSINPLKILAKAGSEIHVAVRTHEGTIQLDLVDMSIRAKELELLASSSFLDISNDIKGAFHNVLLHACTQVNGKNKLKQILDVVKENPTSSFALELNKKIGQGWSIYRSKYSLGLNGVRLVLVLRKKRKDSDNYSESSIFFKETSGNYNDYDNLAKIILQNDKATKNDIFHATRLAKFIAQHHDVSKRNEIWANFTTMASKRIASKVNRTAYKASMNAIKGFMQKDMIL